LLKKPIFPGKTEVDELDLIFSICGSIDLEVFPEAKSYPYYNSFKHTPKQRVLRHLFKDFPYDALELVDKLLNLNPNNRLNAEECLEHKFWVDNSPMEQITWPQYPDLHELQLKKKNV